MYTVHTGILTIDLRIVFSIQSELIHVLKISPRVLIAFETHLRANVPLAVLQRVKVFSLLPYLYYDLAHSKTSCRAHNLNVNGCNSCMYLLQRTRFIITAKTSIMIKYLWFFWCLELLFTFISRTAFKPQQPQTNVSFFVLMLHYLSLLHFYYYSSFH